MGPCGAMVARLTPDQKVACSNHVGVNPCLLEVNCEKFPVKRFHSAFIDVLKQEASNTTNVPSVVEGGRFGS